MRAAERMHAGSRKEKPRKNESRSFDYRRAGTDRFRILADDGLGLANGGGGYVCGNCNSGWGLTLFEQEAARSVKLSETHRHGIRGGNCVIMAAAIQSRGRNS